ncbi:MAG: FAD-dependent thymidylate synthase [Sumerlaeia bacterium]
MPFLSAPPQIRLHKAFTTPFRNTVATARTCYSSKGIIDDGAVGDREKFSPLAKSIYEAGHHTTFQHAHFQFAMENVSRQFIWSFLHAHPFYNSEQVSQRYVTVKPDTMTTPQLPTPEAQTLFARTAEAQFAAYQELCEVLLGPADAAFHARFPRSERMAKKHAVAKKKKAQEIARYVLPVGTTAYLYHTISAVTLLRYWRVCEQQDVPDETRAIVGEMVRQLLEFDPDYEITLQEPLDPAAFPEAEFFANEPQLLSGAKATAFRAEFDAALDGRTSRLVGWSPQAESLVADAVREVIGLTRADLKDAEAIRLALDPGRNRLLGESLNLTTVSKLSRALFHAHYTFKKKISHTADSQDQRHRMTPASRPILAAHVDAEPDYITPQLIEMDDTAARIYSGIMEQSWNAMEKLRTLGAAPEHILYLLPNAASVRFTESADLLNLRHKHEMRLCYNAQEEIWKASVDEADQIRAVQPNIGRYLLPPCTLRAMAGTKPICPEGARYCGVRVWTMDLSEYDRVI